MNVIVKLPNGVEFDGTYNEFTSLYERGIFGGIVYVPQEQEQPQQQEETSEEDFVEEKPTKRKNGKKKKTSKEGLTKDDVKTLMRNLDTPIHKLAKMIGKSKTTIHRFFNKNYGGIKKIRTTLKIKGTKSAPRRNVDYTKQKERLVWVNTRAKTYMSQGLDRKTALSVAMRDYNNKGNQ